MDLPQRFYGKVSPTPHRSVVALACRDSTRFEQTELDLPAVLVDRVHFDDDVIAEAELATALRTAKTMFALGERPVVAADRCDRHETLHEDLVELDEQAERHHPGDETGEALPDL